MFYYFSDISFIILVPAMILALLAQWRVNHNFRKYSRVDSGSGLTGARVARMMLDANGLRNVRIVPISGTLTDHYDPRNRTIALSREVYGSTSVSAVSVACHECGHAVQHANDYLPLTIRDAIVPVVNFADNISLILIVIGLLILFAGDSVGGTNAGNFIFNLGVICFVCVILFHLITLPVEFNASRRGLKAIKELQLVEPQYYRGSKAVLRAAAMTYIAALAMAVANLIRILAIRGRDD